MSVALVSIILIWKYFNLYEMCAHRTFLKNGFLNKKFEDNLLLVFIKLLLVEAQLLFEFLPQIIMKNV